MSRIRAVHLHIFALIAISLLCCLQIRALDYIVVLNDEFGYWAHAVSAVGYDWKELISETPYYSWGYSIWLIPLITLLPSPELWYKAAIFLNIFFLLLSYCLCYKCGRKLFPEINDKVMTLISLIVILYPSNVIYAQVAWTESLSYLLVWIEAYLIISLDEHFTTKYFILSLLIPLYSYAVHNRNIGVLLAGVIIIILLLIKNKKKAGYYLLLPVILVMGYKFIDLVKMHQINTLWSNSKASSINNVGIDTATIASYTSRIFNEIKLLCISIAGKFLYLIIGFELTLPIVFIRFVKDILPCIKEKSIFKNYICSKFWILLTAITMLGISALQMNHWDGRKDFIVYGRYMENALGPLLLLAITETILYVRDMRTALAISLVSILAGIFPVFYYMDNATGGFNSICAPMIGVFFRMVNDTPKAFILLGIFLAFTLSLLYMSASAQNRRLRIALILLCFGLTYCSMGYLLGVQAADSRMGYDDIRVPLREKISGDLAECEIYYVKNQALDSTSMNPKYLQYLIPSRTIHVLLPEEVKNYINRNIVIMTNPNDEENKELLSSSGAQLIDCNYLLAVYSTK